jgi:hypothetical protein
MAAPEVTHLVTVTRCAPPVVLGPCQTTKFPTPLAATLHGEKSLGGELLRHRTGATLDFFSGGRWTGDGPVCARPRNSIN